MPLTVSARAATTAGSCLLDRRALAAPRPMRSCAIHQPNLLPRLSTLAKLYAAHVWVVLDDVQFARQDYQHRARLGALHVPERQQWLSLETHLPNGRATLIRDAQLSDPERAIRRLLQLPAQHYHMSSHWPQVQAALAASVVPGGGNVGTAAIAEASTVALLRHLGWRGTVVRSSDLASSSGRSARLADLTVAVGADTYLCGTGGMRYLDNRPFNQRDLRVYPFRPPTTTDRLWAEATKISAVWAIARFGPARVRIALDDLRVVI